MKENSYQDSRFVASLLDSNGSFISRLCDCPCFVYFLIVLFIYFSGDSPSTSMLTYLKSYISVVNAGFESDWGC